MKTNWLFGLHFIFLFSCTLSAFSQDFIRAGEISSYPGAYPYGFYQDDNGKLLLSGTISGDVDMDISRDAEFLLSPISKRDIFVAKYEPGGDFIQAFNLGGKSSGNYSAMDIVADQEGNIFICGGSMDWIDFDPTEGKDSVWTGGNMFYLAKYGPDGEYLWAHGLGFDNTGNGVYAYKMAVDKVDGSVYVCGELRGMMDFDPSEEEAIMGSEQWYDMFLAKYSKDGNYIWGKYLTNSGEYRICRPEALVLDGDRNIIMGGNFSGWYDMDPSEGVQLMNQHTTEGYSGSDAYLASFDRDGNYRWHLNFGSGYGNYLRGLKYFEENIYAVGAFMDTVDFDPSEAEFILESAEMDESGYIAVYNTDGNFQNAIGMRGFEGEYNTSVSQIHDVAFDGLGKCYVIGQFAGTIDCDPTDDSAKISSTGGFSDYDMFLGQYDLDLSYQWVINAGGNKQEVGKHTAVTADGEVVAYGFFDGDCDFDPSEGETWLYNTAGHDLYMAWYFAFEPSGIAGTISGPGSRIEFYPNPSGQYLNIESAYEMKHMMIYSSTGKLVSSVDLSGRSTRVDLSALPPAYYLLRIECENSVEHGRIVKLE